MPSLPASIKRIGSKTTEKWWRHRFPHYKSKGAFCCHGYQSFDPICPKTLCSLSLTPVMLHIEFDQDWSTGFGDIQVWKCGRRRTDGGPLVYYKLTLWAFGSGELIKQKHKYIYNFTTIKKSVFQISLYEISLSLERRDPHFVQNYSHFAQKHILIRWHKTIPCATLEVCRNDSGIVQDNSILVWTEHICIYKMKRHSTLPLLLVFCFSFLEKSLVMLICLFVWGFTAQST